MRKWRAGARGRVQAHRAGHAHLPHRRAARSVRRAGAAHGDGVRSREARARLREHRGARARRAACSTSRRLGVRVDDHGAPSAEPLGKLGGVPHPARRRARRARSRSRGSPIDQFSFLEGDDGHLNVLVRANGRGDGMWASETRGGRARVACACRSAASPTAATAPPAERYQPLPTPQAPRLQNRYVGQLPALRRRHRLVPPRSYAGGCDLRGALRRQCGAFRRRTASTGSRRWATTRWRSAATARDLHFTSVRLAPYPVVAGTLHARQRGQGETRSHGFFYNEPASGLLGLPIIGGDQPRHAPPAAAVLGVGALSCATSRSAFASSARWTQRATKQQRRLPRLLRRLVRQLAAAVPPQPRVRADGLRDRRGAGSSGDGIAEIRRVNFLAAWRISSRTGLR